ncbi:flagellar filament capping protein FliD [Bordetella sp. FB-8]|uniref:flagellar filament capping protein FliD n=1 Tax=Bordetella sp. FB-8 TaxID=1159870 RepID=UPI00036B8347|nr:flagellar filament capping protein FliD [Bordetella sp. FB-8]
MSSNTIFNTAHAGLITSLGVGTSLDLSGLLDQLQKAELSPTTVLQNRISSVQTKISAYGTLQSAVQAVLSAAQALGKATTFSAVKSSVTGSDVTVATTAGAIAGSYKVLVTALAQADQLQSSTFIDSTIAKSQSFGSGASITITLANGDAETIDLGNAKDTSLQGVINAINSNSKAGVNATAVNDGNGGYYLMLTGAQTGASNAISSVAVGGNNTLAGALDYAAGGTGGALTVSQSARNAAVTVNGIAISSGTNTVQDAVNGVTLTLNSVTASGGGNILNIVGDPSVTQGAVGSFVGAYNALQSVIASLTKFDATAGTRSALTGDNVTHRAQTSLAQALRVFVGSGALHSLADMGLSTNPLNGKLSMDGTKLSEAIAKHPADLAGLFTGSGGLAAQIQGAADTILGKTGVTGMLASVTSGLQQTITALQNQQTSLISRVTGDMNRYRSQFSHLSTLLSTMNATSTYLTQQFNAMNKSN